MCVALIVRQSITQQEEYRASVRRQWQFPVWIRDICPLFKTGLSQGERVFLNLQRNCACKHL
jgi:hypothetical protein